MLEVWCTFFISTKGGSEVKRAHQSKKKVWNVCIWTFLMGKMVVTKYIPCDARSLQNILYFSGARRVQNSLAVGGRWEIVAVVLDKKQQQNTFTRCVFPPFNIKMILYNVSIIQIISDRFCV